MKPSSLSARSAFPDRPRLGEACCSCGTTPQVLKVALAQQHSAAGSRRRGRRWRRATGRGRQLESAAEAGRAPLGHARAPSGNTASACCASLPWPRSAAWGLVRCKCCAPAPPPAAARHRREERPTEQVWVASRRRWRRSGLLWQANAQTWCRAWWRPAPSGTASGRTPTPPSAPVQPSQVVSSTQNDHLGRTQLPLMRDSTPEA